MRETQEQMLEEMKAKVRDSGLFASAEEVAELFGNDRAEFAARISEWNACGAIFSIKDEGIELFPLFVFECLDEVRPRPAVAEVIGTFGKSLSRWAIASWFIGLNSYLDDQCPKDILENDPAWVVEAARDEMREILRT